MIGRVRGLLQALAIAALLVPMLAQAAASVVGMQLVGTSRVGRTTFDYTYKITVQNGTPALVAAKATVVSTAPATQIMKSTVSLGDVAAGATVTSTDTFTLRQDRSVPFNAAALAWTVGGASLEISLSDAFVAPNGSVVVTPTLRDASGAVMSNAGYQFVVGATPVGTVTGNAPVISGLTVSFPKLTKTLISPNPTIDPNGDYADTDPSDPNFGRETGGTYRITVTLAGGALSSNQNVTVVPSGAAQASYTANQYAAQLGNALAIALRASQTNDTLLLAQAAAALRAVDANRDFTTASLSTSSALAAPDSGLITPSQLIAKGFTAGPQDAAFATALANVATRIVQARTQVDATDTTALNQAAIDALQTALNNCKAALQALQGLRPSALGAYQQQDQINRVLGTELPRLMDAVKIKAGRMLGVVATSSIEAEPRFAAAPRLDDPFAGLLDFESGLASKSKVKSLVFDRGAPAVVSPEAMYAATRPVQFLSFFSTAFSIFTDLSGFARANIIELSITLANSLLNIEIANAINRNAPPAFGLDYCLGSASFSFVCPNYSPSTIGGFGFGRDPSAVKVAIIGCIDSYLLRNLITLRVPKSLDAFIRLSFKIISIAKSLQQDGGVAAVVVPDFIDEDFLGLTTDLMYFNSGFPRVNQGRLPCVGTVIVMNTRVGGLAALNVNLLAQCG